MPETRYFLRFPATLEGLHRSAGTLRELLDARQLVGGPRYNVELAFEEAASNIVRHGCPAGGIDATIDFGDNEIVLTFEDDGVPFDPRERPDPPMPASLAEAQVGGRGLVLLRKILTRMAYERTSGQRNLLTLVMPAR